LSEQKHYILGLSFMRFFCSPNVRSMMADSIINVECCLIRNINIDIKNVIILPRYSIYGLLLSYVDLKLSYFQILQWL
jgi:hypothetical protein